MEIVAQQSRSPLADLPEAMAQLAREMRPFREQATLSLHAVAIAQELAKAQALIEGVDQTPWPSLPVPYQQKCLRLAEMVIAELNPDVRVSAADRATRRFDEWMNGPYTGTVPTNQEMASRAIGFFVEEMQHPLHRYERPCWVCGGTLEYDELHHGLQCASCYRTFEVTR